MTRSIVISYHALPGTAAGVARAGGSIVIADRPQGSAGGQGLGANGAQLLAAAIGGCFWNDLHSIGAARGHDVTGAGVEVDLTLAGNPARIVRAVVTARLPAAAEPVFRQAVAETVIGNSLMAAFPVSFRLDGQGGAA